jgi:hypothetical protein
MNFQSAELTSWISIAIFREKFATLYISSGRLGAMTESFALQLTFYTSYYYYSS